MTSKIKIALMAAGLMAGATLTSCSNNEGNELSQSTQAGNLLIKSPEMKAYSSSHLWNTYGSRAGEDSSEEGTEVKGYVSHNDVEINLSLNEEQTEPGVTEEGETFNKDYISSHFSLHVRTARDVQVRIPVPVDYYCDADDMAIVKKHLEDHFVYGDQNHSLSLNINGSTVNVNVAYDAEGFTITTSGINETVINYLAENYEDGITFEIWNYFNNTITRAELQRLLNNSTVEFVEGDDNVDYYVNAFNQINTLDEEDNIISTANNQWDCTVSIVSSQSNNFNAIEPGSEDYLNDFHGYNGSLINKVYKHRRPEPSED